MLLLRDERLHEQQSHRGSSAGDDAEVSGLAVSSRMVDATGPGDILGGIAGGTSRAKRDRASRLLLKAIRSLPEREQDAVLAFLLDRALVNPVDTETRIQASRTYSAHLPGFAPLRWAWSPEPSGQRAIAAVILQRLAADEAVDQIAGVLGLDSGLLQAALRELATRPHGSGQLAGIFRQLAEGSTLAQAARELGLTKHEIVAALQPSEKLVSTVCSALGRASLPGPPATYLGTSAQGPLRTMPVRFPEQQYQRLKEWCEQNNFPMAVVVRGVVERFLDEQQRRAA